jgi:hypothetical protein
MKLENTDQVEHISGEVVVKPFDRSGRPLEDPLSIFKSPTQLDLSADGYVMLKDNLVVNLGRQTLAYLIGGKDYPANSWLISKVSWGTGEEVPRFTDTTASPQAVTNQTIGGENEIAYDATNKKKAIASVDWPTPFMTRFEATLGADEAVGYLIREMALWTSNDNLFARKVFPAINKTSDFGLSFLWRIRT